MTSRWPIFFSSCLLIVTAASLPAAEVSGQVDLRDSHRAAVTHKRDFSGVVVSLQPMPGIPLNPEAKAGPWENQPHAVIKQKDKTFSPHLLAIPVGAYVDFPNLDPIFHSAFSSYSGQVFDVGLYPPGSQRSVRFTRAGVVRVFCNIHSSMSAMIVVLATPYFAVSKADGSWDLPDVPAGEYELQVVHERSTDAVLRSLRRRVTVGAEPLKLPPLVISEAGFLPIPHKNKYGLDYPRDSASPLPYPAGN